MGSRITNPFEFFTDSSGDPLDGGYVYIGSVNFNAETNPIQVYWDAALSIPAAQPIRTVSGYPSRSGTAAQIYTSQSDYSITVRNNARRLVFSSSSTQGQSNLQDDLSNNTDPTKGAGMVGWSRAALSAAITTVHQMLDAQPVSVWEFAHLITSKPNPADPTTWEWTPAIAAWAASLKPACEVPDGLYLLAAGISIPANKALILRPGAIIRRKAGSGVYNMLTLTGSGSTVIGGTIDGNRAADSLTPSNPAHRFSGVHAVGQAFTTVLGVKVVGTVNNETNGGIYLDNCPDSTVERCIATDNDRAGIVVFNSARAKILNNIGHSNLGSGITSSNNADCLYDGNHTYSNGSAGTYTGLNASGLRSRVIGNLSYSNTGSGVNVGEASHTADNAVVIGNVCYGNTLDGISIQNSTEVMAALNQASGNTRAGIRLFTNATGCEVVDNTTNSNGAPGVHALSGSNHSISGNKARSNASAGVYIDTGVDFCKVTENDARGNGTVAGANATGILVIGDDCDLVGNTSRDDGSGAQLYGIWLAGAQRANLVGNRLGGNVTAALREASSPTYSTRGNRYGTDSPQGQFTATTASTVTTVTNNNARTVSRIKVFPLNAAAAARPAFVSSVSAGVSFNVTFASNSAGTELYGYEID